MYSVILNFVFNIMRCKQSTEKQVQNLQRLLSYKLLALLSNILLPLSVPKFPSVSLVSSFSGQNSTYLELQSWRGHSFIWLNNTLPSWVMQNSAQRHPWQNGHLASNWTLDMTENSQDEAIHFRVESFILSDGTSARLFLPHIYQTTIMYSHQEHVHLLSHKLTEVLWLSSMGMEALDQSGLQGLRLKAHSVLQESHDHAWKVSTRDIWYQVLQALQKNLGEGRARGGSKEQRRSHRRSERGGAWLQKPTRHSARRRAWTLVSGGPPSLRRESALRCVIGRLSRVRPLCGPMDQSLPGSFVQGILQAILEWAAIPSSRRSSQPRDQTRFS